MRTKLLCLLVLIPTLAAADPGPATRYLINERASLLDIGIVRIDVALGRIKESLGEQFDSGGGMSGSEVSGVATYDFGDDRLEILLSIITAPNDGLERGCEALLKFTEIFIGNSLQRYFSHYGYSDKDQPKDLYDKLRDRAWLKCEVLDSERFVPLLSVEMNMADRKMRVTKE